MREIKTMDTERLPENQPRQKRQELDLDHMREDELEQILMNLLIVKYPGIEQEDIDRLFVALDVGDIERVEQLEADIAFKSAQWKLAVLDMESDT